MAELAALVVRQTRALAAVEVVLLETI